MGDQRWHASVRMSQVILLDGEGEARGLTRSEIFLVALSLGIDALRAESLKAQDRHTSVKKPKAQHPKPSVKKVAKPAPSKQIAESEIAALSDDEPAPPPSKFVSPLSHGGMPTNAKEAATMLNAFFGQRGLKNNAAGDQDDLLDQVLSDGPAKASSSPQEPVSEPWRPTYANPKDAEPVANPFADDGED